VADGTRDWEKRLLAVNRQKLLGEKEVQAALHTSALALTDTGSTGKCKQCFTLRDWEMRLQEVPQQKLLEEGEVQAALETSALALTVAPGTRNWEANLSRARRTNQVSVQTGVRVSFKEGCIDLVDKSGLCNVDAIVYATYKRALEEEGTPFELLVDHQLKATTFTPFKFFAGCGIFPIHWGKSRKTNPHMRAFHMAWFSFFLAFCGWFCLAPLMIIIREELGLCDNQDLVDDTDAKCICKEDCKQMIGNAKLGSVGSTVVARLVTGSMLEMFGPVKTQGVMLSMGAIFVGGAMFISDSAGLVITMTLMGSLGATFVTNQFWMPFMFAPTCVGLANGTAGGWGNVGGGFANGVMPIIFEVMNSFVDRDLAWRLSLIAPMLALSSMVPIMYFCSQDTPMGPINMKRDLKKDAVSWWDYWTCMKDKNVLLLSFHYAICFGTELNMNQELVPHFYDYFGLEFVHAGMIALAFGLMNMFARSLGGATSDWANLHWGMRGRLWTHFTALFFEAAFLYLFGCVNNSNDMNWIGALVLLICFSVCVQAAEGTTYSIVPSIKPSHLGIVSALVGAGGNVGAVVFIQSLYKKDVDGDPLWAFQIHGMVVLAGSFSVMLMSFPFAGSMFQAPKLARYCSSGLFSYAIEWAPVKKELVPVAHYNPPWRLMQLRRSKNWVQSLYTTASYTTRLKNGQSAVGLVFERGQSRFVQNVQSLPRSQFTRVELATKHHIKSILFMSAIGTNKQPGVIELGTSHELVLAKGVTAEHVALVLQSKHPANAVKYFHVKDDFDISDGHSDVNLAQYCRSVFSHAILWIKVGKKIQAVRHYNRQCSIEESIALTGMVELYTTSSYAVQMVSGKGAVGTAMATNRTIFFPNLQTVDSTDFLRADLAQKYNIKSAIFMPIKPSESQQPDAIIEVGTSMELTMMPGVHAADVMQALEHTGEAQHLFMGHTVTEVPIGRSQDQVEIVEIQV